MKESMNTCVIAPDNGMYSETFIRAHIERLPGKTTFLYGGLFPTFLPNGELLLKPPSFPERVRRSLLSRLFRLNFDEYRFQCESLKKYLQDNKIDAVLAEYGLVATRVMDVCEEAGVALVAHFHGFDAYEHETLQKFAADYQKLFQKADAIVAVSKHMQNQLIKLGAPKNKVHYNPCGMDSKIFHGSTPEHSAPIFIATGRFVDKKSPHLTLFAFTKVLKRVPQAKLIMVGNGPLLDACMSMVEHLGIKNAVQFLGPQSHEKVAQLMREARAFVQHSRVVSSGDSEGTPVAVEEAGGSGLPVVSTFHAGIPDVVLDGVTGFLVKEGDVDAMADRMIKLAEDPALAGRMGIAARERVLAQFTLDHTIKNLADIISIAIQGKK